MTAKANDPVAADLVLTRFVAAPRDLVFRVWTEPQHLARWWGPEGFTNPRCEADPQPGGRLRIDMRSPDGTVYPCAGFFLEVTPPEKLAFTSGCLDDKDVLMMEILNTVTFTERDGGTEIVLHAHVLKKSPESQRHLAGMEAGWTQSLVRLAAYAEQQNP